MKMQKLIENWRRYLTEQQESPLPQKTKLPKLFFLVGPPAVGKSEWIKKNYGQNPEGKAHIINRDEIVEKIAKEMQVGSGTYDDMYMTGPIHALKYAELEKKFSAARSNIGFPNEEDLKKAQEGFRAQGKEYVLSGQIMEYATQFTNIANKIAQEFSSENPEQIQKYGKLIPFDLESFKIVVLKFGVPIERIVPFEYEKIKLANDAVTAKLDATRKATAILKQPKKDVIIDMMNVSLNERNEHRKHLIAAIENIQNVATANPKDIIKYYDEYAIVFAPKEGYSPDMKEKIKARGIQRAAEIKAQGGSKTIPPSVYDRIFSTYEKDGPPKEGEEFPLGHVQFITPPSLLSLKTENNNFKIKKSYLIKVIKEELAAQKIKNN